MIFEVFLFGGLAIAIVGAYLYACYEPKRQKREEFDIENFRVKGFPTQPASAIRHRGSERPAYAFPSPSPSDQLLYFGIDSIPDAHSSPHQSSYGDYSYGSSSDSSSSDCSSSSGSSDSGSVCDSSSGGGSD